ncbi:MAG: hypothetical protein AB1610_03795 [Nitrospirota bacterium]
MRAVINKIMVTILAFIGFVSLIAVTTEALEPKLLWEKEFKHKISTLDLATETGDVIVNLKAGREVILYDKNGNERFHWGPRIDFLIKLAFLRMETILPFFQGIQKNMQRKRS